MICTNLTAEQFNKSIT